MSYIYLIRSQQFFKIGIAGNPEVRILELQIGNPIKLELIAAHEFEDAEPAEWVLHQRFSKKRVSGEWFLLDDSDVDEFNRVCRSFESVGNALETRICTKCQQEKPANSFRKRWNFCRDCIKEYTRAYRATHKQARKESKRRYRQKYKDKLNERQRTRYAEKKKGGI